MSKKVTTQYFCDICGKEIKGVKPHSLKIEVKFDDQFDIENKGISLLELCEDCYKKSISEYDSLKKKLSKKSDL